MCERRRALDVVEEGASRSRGLEDGGGVDRACAVDSMRPRKALAKAEAAAGIDCRLELRVVMTMVIGRLGRWQ